MRDVLSIYLSILVFHIIVSSQVYASKTASAQDGPFTHLFDTVEPSSVPLSGEALAKRAGWTELPPDEVVHKFRGDVVFFNDKLAIVLRRSAPGAEIYSRKANDFSKRAVLAPGSGDLSARFSLIKIVQNNPHGVVVDADFTAPDNRTLTLRYGLQMGLPFVKTEPGQGVERLGVQSPCRFVVLPDFFADDMVIDARQFPVSNAELPGENFIMHMIDDGQAILMCVWDKQGEDVRITLTGRGNNKVISGSEIHYPKDGTVWVALMADEGIWHTRQIKDKDAGKEIRLAWKQPFPAQWRVDWQKLEGEIDSWEMLTQKPDGEYVKHGWFGQPESFGTPDWMRSNRRRWTTVLGWFRYPCWVDKSGQGYLQPLTKKVRFQGPALIYPINRLKETPLGKFTVVDIVRQTLGVGPCEYILDVEGQRKRSAGIATCAARDKLNAIYEKKQQKQRRAEVEKALVDVLAFIQHIRIRIEDYISFARQMQQYLAAQRKAHPELAEPITALENIIRRMDGYLAKRKAEIKTPEYAVQLVEQFRAELLDYEGNDALQKCKKITSGLVQIGGNQDELVGECRMVVRILRQQAGLAMAKDPRMTEIARQIRQRTRQILRKPVSYEAPRH